MSDSDWSPKLAIGALIALVLFAALALFEQNASLAPRHIASPPSAEQSKQEADCQANSNSYYNCRDLIAQEGVRVATDAIVNQGERQFWLAVVNLALLVGTFVASIVATFMAVEAVNVSREDYESGAMPLLQPRFEDWNWNPDRPEYPDADAETRIKFINVGRGLATIDVVWYRHFICEEDGPPPPPIVPRKVDRFRWLPHGVMVQIKEESQIFQEKVRSGVSHDTFHGIKNPQWVIQGFVFYTSVTRGLYLTGFSYYYDPQDKAFYLGPVEGQESKKYNYTRKLDRKAWAREDEQIFFESQY